MRWQNIPAYALIILFFVLFVPAVYAGDTTPPNSFISYDPSTPDGNDGWYTQTVDVTITAQDLESGVKYIRYSLNDGDWQEHEVAAQANLISNPSFEEHTNFLPDYWSRPTDTSKIFVSSNYQVDGVYSVRFKSNTSPDNYISNKEHYGVAQPLTTYFFSVWVKSDITGFGPYFEIVAITDTGDQVLHQSESLLNTTDFELYNATVTTPTGTQGLYVNLYSVGSSGDTYFDAVYLGEVSAESSVNFNVPLEGEHNIRFYAVDRALNEENINQDFFKVDITAPSPWRNFNYENPPGANNHAFEFEVEVMDNMSGVNPTTGEFQYYISAYGWGLFENISNCGGDFLVGEWDTTSFEWVDEPNVVRLETPLIDFCNSNWDDTKMIRFRVEDVAGNLGQSSNFTINSPWVETHVGEVGSNYAIKFTGDSVADNFIHSKTTVEGINSTEDMIIENYNSVVQNTAAFLINNNVFSPLPGNRFPTVGGLYYYQGNYDLDNQNLNNYHNGNICSVIAIDGDLKVSVHQGGGFTLSGDDSCLIFLVTGNVTIDDRMRRLEAYFVVDGVFDTVESTRQLTITGGVSANEIKLGRSLPGNQNQDDAAEIFNYDVGMLLKAAHLLTTTDSKANWIELK